MLRVFATLKVFLGDGTRRKLSLVFLTIFSLSLLVITAVSLIVAINQKNTLNNVRRETPFQAAAQLQIQTFKLVQTLETSNLGESERAQEISIIINRLSKQIERQRITILRANLDASSSSTRIIEEMTHTFFSLKSDISRRGTLSPETRQRASEELKVLLPDFVFFLQEAKSLEDRIERDMSELILRFIWWHLSLAILTFVSGSILAIYLFRSAYITRSALLEVNETRQVAGEAHGRLLDALENMPEGFALFDRERRLVLCNDNYRRLYVPNGDLLAPGARLDDILFLAAERGQFPQALGNISRWVGEEIARLGNFAGPIVQHLPDDRWTKTEDRRTTSGGIVSICTDIKCYHLSERFRGFPVNAKHFRKAIGARAL